MHRIAVLVVLLAVPAGAGDAPSCRALSRAPRCKSFPGDCTESLTHFEKPSDEQVAGLTDGLKGARKLPALAEWLRDAGRDLYGGTVMFGFHWTFEDLEALPRRENEDAMKEVSDNLFAIGCLDAWDAAAKLKGNSAAKRFAESCPALSTGGVKVTTAWVEYVALAAMLDDVARCRGFEASPTHRAVVKALLEAQPPKP